MVPNGWESRHLEELSIKISDGIHTTPKYADSSSVYFVNGNNLKNGQIVIQESTKFVDEIDAEKHRKELSDRTILMSINGTIGNLAYYRGENVVLGKSACFINVKKDVDVDFIYNILNSEKTQAFYTSELTGSTIKNLSLKTIKLTKVNLPPLPEQHKIAQILSTWDRGIATTERLIAISKQQKKALMQQLLTGKKRLLNPETGKAFEGEWEEECFDRLFDIEIGGTPSRNNDAYWDAKLESDNHWLSIADLKGKKISRTSERITDLGVAKSNVSLIPKGTIVMSFKLTIGRRAFLDFDCYTNEAICALLIKDKKRLDNSYLYQALEVVDFEQEIDQAVKGKTLNKAKLKRLRLLLPSYMEQQKIASVLTAADREIELLEAKLAHLKQEKKALMQQLLTGKRRVKVDSAETESAIA